MTGNGPLRSFQNFSGELAPQSLIDPHFFKIKPEFSPSSYLTGSRGIHSPFFSTGWTKKSSLLKQQEKQSTPTPQL